MDVSNASLYDGGSAAAEAVLMACSATGRHGRVVTAASVHPEYRADSAHVSGEPGHRTGDGRHAGRARSTPHELAAGCHRRHGLRAGAAAELLRLPGRRASDWSKAAHERGALVVVAVDPISLGLLKRPGDYGADIVVAEGQSLGTPMQYGGPYLGIMACREQFVRRMPGRIAGQTVDRRGKRCWVLTLQTREQHIRREKATSNICTNQGLFALRASVYLAAMGPQGLREVGRLPACAKSRYAPRQLTSGDRLVGALSTGRRSRNSSSAIRPGTSTSLLAEALERGFFAGVPLGQWYPELADCFLVCVTEKRTRQEIDGLATCIGQ